MEQRFSAADGDDGRAKIAEEIDAAQHLVGGHGLGEIVELVAVGAGEIAAADRDEMREQRMVGRHDGLEDLAQAVHVPFRRLEFAAPCEGSGCRRSWQDCGCQSRGYQ
jgi:hypothetical protein